MIIPVLVGLIASVLVAATQLERTFIHLPLLRPFAVLGVALIAVALQLLILDRRGYRKYDGLADLFIHIHSPGVPDSPLRWGVRGLISFLLAVCGGFAGPEGAAVEWAHSIEMKLRARSTRWFEQRRRTDAAASLSAGISAAFAAPFTGVLLPMELGIGGRSMSTALAALSAWAGVKFISGIFPFGFSLGEAYADFQFATWKEWVAALAIGLACGGIGAGIILLIRSAQENFSRLRARDSAWLRIFVAGVLLFILAYAYPKGHAQSADLLQGIFGGQGSSFTPWLLSLSGILALSVVLAGFGTVGLFWPLFALGGFLGFGASHWIVEKWLEQSFGFGIVGGLVGASALWGAVLGAPLSGAVLVFELTRNLHILIAALAGAFLARGVREKLGLKSLVTSDLRARGLVLADGRSSAVLQGIPVREAMITDHEIVYEHESLSDLYQKLIQARYPFFPVINAQGSYRGLLTIDIVQDAWRTEGSRDMGTSNSPLSRLLEAKDLLYRAGIKAKTIQVNDPLSSTAGMFEEMPCVPVLGDDGRVLGLLFSYNVRLSYEREVARRSLKRENRE